MLDYIQVIYYLITTPQQCCIGWAFLWPTRFGICFEFISSILLHLKYGIWYDFIVVDFPSHFASLCLLFEGTDTCKATLIHFCEQHNRTESWTEPYIVHPGCVCLFLSHVRGHWKGNEKHSATVSQWEESGGGRYVAYSQSRGSVLTLIAAFSGWVFVAQVELHLLLSRAPFLQVLIHHVVKGDCSLWRGENIWHNTFKNNKPCTLILEMSQKSFVPRGKKAG